MSVGNRAPEITGSAGRLSYVLPTVGPPDVSHGT